MNTGRIVGIVSFMLLVAIVWTSLLFRFDLQVVTNHEGYAVAYRLDRWNGDLRLIENDQWYSVVEGNPDDLQEPLTSPKNSTF